MLNCEQPLRLFLFNYSLPHIALRACVCVRVRVCFAAVPRLSPPTLMLKTNAAASNYKQSNQYAETPAAFCAVRTCARARENSPPVFNGLTR